MIATDVASRGLDIKGMGLGFAVQMHRQTEERMRSARVVFLILGAAASCEILHDRGSRCILTEDAALGVKLVINYDAANTPEDCFAGLGLQV